MREGRTECHYEYNQVGTPKCDSWLDPVGLYSVKLYKLISGHPSKGRKVSCMRHELSIHECQAGFWDFSSLDVSREPVVGAKSYVAWQEVRLY